MNKRGFYTDYLADFIALGIYVIIFLLFFIIFSMHFRGCGNQYSREYELVSDFDSSIKQNQNLLNFLRTEVEIEGEIVLIAKLIADSVENDNYDELEIVTKDTFGYYDELGANKCSQLTIINKKSILKIIRSESCSSSPISSEDLMNANFGKISIPLFYSDSPDKVDVILLQKEGDA